MMASDVLGVRFAGCRHVTVETSTGCYSLDVGCDKTGTVSMHRFIGEVNKALRNRH
ncbi:hypothetical protein [Kosakonia sacchari]|uniref:hypothetical protein n=1 Tax=Kosakonia sacchari TaxID=1158459 RepID=UPI0020C77149|nr:hypothetical protein [Kosakonia sacchari]